MNGRYRFPRSYFRPCSKGRSRETGFRRLMDESEKFGPSVVGHEGQRVGQVVGGALVVVGADHEEGAS